MIVAIKKKKPSSLSGTLRSPIRCRTTNEIKAIPAIFSIAGMYILIPLINTLPLPGIQSLKLLTGIP